MSLRLERLALIGFGEAGGILGAELAALGRFPVASYDILLEDAARRGAMEAKMRAAKVEPAASLAAALAGADLVISAVTAGEARKLATSAARLLKPGQILLEINSVSPETRRGNAALIEGAGAAYVEAAVMARDSIGSMPASSRVCTTSPISSERRLPCSAARLTR